MDNWRLVGRVATAFGIISVIFAAVAAILNYQINTYIYGRLVPEGFIQVNVVNAMLPYLIIAVLSFAAAAIAGSHARDSIPEVQVPVEPQTTEHPVNQP
jgi:hypothetical protein